MSFIPDETIAEIRFKADIVKIIGRHVDLKKAGRNHKGLCPFHHEKSPSFNVNGEKGFYYCFGCQQKGDVFSFLMEYEGRTFVEAAENLAGEFGVIIPETASKGEDYQRHKSDKKIMLDLNEKATEFFRGHLKNKDVQNPGRDYLAHRGIGEDTASRFRLGFAPDKWDGLCNTFAKSQDSFKHAEKVGLIVKRPQADGHYDRFRGRLMCPVMNTSGDVVGFSGRLLGDHEKSAKYINSSESLLYKKSKLLYGAPQARDGMRRAGQALLVEGNFDVLMLHEHGFDFAVAPLGTALTLDQGKLLQRMVGKVTLLFDGDKAGRAATLKSLKVLLQADCEVGVALIPLGEDPDSLLKSKGKEALSEVIAKSQPAIEYFIHDVWSKRSQSAHDRSEAIKEAAVVLRYVSDSTKRDLSVGVLAQALNIKEEVLRKGLRRALRGPQSPQAQPHVAPPQKSTNLPPNRLELDICVNLFEYPELIDTAKELNILSLFQDPQTIDMVKAAYQGSSMLDSTTNPHILQSLMASSKEKSKNPEDSFRSLVNQMKMLQQKEQLLELQKQAEAAARSGDQDLQRQLVGQILEQRKKVN